MTRLHLARTRALFATAASGLALVLATPALAQDAAAPTAEEEGIDDIVVTANRVEQNLQDVPIAVSAVSGDRLLETGTTSLENIGDLIPSVTFRKGTTSANSAIVMRGVGTISFSIAAEPSVSTVVDGIVLSRSGQSFIDLVDIDRIEVLRGPQGTLFGKNASAGLVNIVSRGGTDEVEMEGSAEFYEGSEYRFRGAISGPLGGNFSGRLTGFYGSYDGNIFNTNPNVNRPVNGYEHQGIRGILDYDSGPTRLRLIADFFTADDDCCAEVTGVSRGGPINALIGFPLRGEDTRAVNHNLVTRTEDQQYSATFSGDFDISDTHTVSLIAGYRNWENTEFRDGDFLPVAVIGTGQLHDQGTVETDQYSIEARIASDQSSAFSYQAGVFYWRSNNTQDFTRRNIQCTTSTLPALPGGAIPCNTTTVNTTTDATTFPSATSRSEVESTNYAVFGQATYRFSDMFSITGGLRWTKDELDYSHFRAPGVDLRTGLPATGAGVSGNPAGGLTTANPPGNGTNLSTGGSSNSNFSGRASVQFEPSDDFLFYASYTRGYKGPAFNIFFNHTAPTNSVPIDEETSDSFELGMRSQFLDNRLQFNATAFQVTYDGFQANNFILLGTPPTVVSNLTNAGQVRSTGFEVDAVAEPFDGLTLRASVAYADAKVRRFNPNPSTNAPSALNGTKLPLAPEWSYNIGADYETDLGSSLRFYAGTSYAYTDDQFSDLGQAGPVDSYGIWNASIGLSDPEDKVRVSLVGRNLGDTRYVLLNTSAGQRLHIPRDADRYFGVTLRVRTR
jgi:iron complex outermembrane recepter protein